MFNPIHRASGLCTAFTAGLIALSSAAAQADSATWFYRLGEPMSARQVNSCSDRAEVDRLAKIFHQQGPRPGYSALSQSPKCRIGVMGFTPVERVMSVPVQEGGVLLYTVHFLRVEKAAGGVAYVVTTRSVEGD